MWAHLQEPGQLELTTLAISELPRIPEAGRDLFDDVVARKRALIRSALERDDPDADGRPTDAGVAAAIVPRMVFGVALGRQVCRAFETSPLSADQIGKAVTDIIVRGVGAARPAR